MAGAGRDPGSRSRSAWAASGREPRPRQGLGEAFRAPPGQLSLPVAAWGCSEADGRQQGRSWQHRGLRQLLRPWQGSVPPCCCVPAHARDFIRTPCAQVFCHHGTARSQGGLCMGADGIRVRRCPVTSKARPPPPPKTVKSLPLGSAEEGARH